MLSLYSGHNTVVASDNQAPPGALGPVVPMDSPVTFHYAVTNPGNVPLASVVVTDDNGTPSDPTDDFHPTFTGGDTNGNNQLDPGETWTYTASQPARMGQYTNVVTTTGTDVTGQTVTANATSHYFGLCPVVEDFVRNGVHHQPTRLVLTYSGAIDPAFAENLANYQLVATGRDQVVPLASAVYDPTAHTVTLTPARSLNVHYAYQLTAQNPCLPGQPFVGLLNRKFSLGSIVQAKPSHVESARVPHGPTQLSRGIPVHSLHASRTGKISARAEPAPEHGLSPRRAPHRFPDGAFAFPGRLPCRRRGPPAPAVPAWQGRAWLRSRWEDARTRFLLASSGRMGLDGGPKDGTPVSFRGLPARPGRRGGECGLGPAPAEPKTSAPAAKPSSEPKKARPARKPAHRDRAAPTWGGRSPR